MLTMRPIDEPDVIQLLNDNRFGGSVNGYVMMEGPVYLGHALFCVKEKTVTLLDTDIKDPLHVDGIARACIAAGQHRGARAFAVNEADPALAKWWQAYGNAGTAPVAIDQLFHSC